MVPHCFDRQEAVDDSTGLAATRLTASGARRAAHSSRQIADRSREAPSEAPIATARAATASRSGNRSGVDERAPDLGHQWCGRRTHGAEHPRRQ